MSSNGKAIFDALGQVRSFYEELALMFGALDSLMASADWSSVGGTTVISQTSASLNRPRRWLPSFLFRPYTSKKYPHLFVVTKVLMNKEFQSQHGEADVEPLLSTVLMDFGAGRDASKLWKWEFAAWHPISSGSSGAGAVTSISREPDKMCPAVRVATWAVPLVSIKDNESLGAWTVAIVNEWAPKLD